MVTAWSLDAAKRWPISSASFAKVRKIGKTVDYTKDPSEINPGLVKNALTHGMAHCGSHLSPGSGVRQGRPGDLHRVDRRPVERCYRGLADRDPLARKRCAVMRPATSVKIANPMMPKTTYNTISITRLQSTP